ncbi:recombinase family protein [Ornithinibacillus massiliensis]|uniref:Recombinase family protein n=1 Tax=Ornithinibacillus massiliensis TaxID=1944633 RepID=A0ABS5MAI8_9BACI|nr:recombinase family protein [Ornithinibacillus massiliensis]MBS3678962.1 recombinase family protein [Ornithinibacillus massiliensis]
MKFHPLQPEKSIALYCRVSTDEQARDGVSLAEQQERLKAYCTAMGWNEEPILFIDDGYSAKSLERPQLKKLINEVTSGHISKVLITKLDRISRKLKDLLEIIDLFQEHEVSFISISESFDTNTPSGRLTLQVLGAVAEFERERIRERVIDNMHHAASKGKWLTQSPYGYDLVDKELVVNNQEADVVKKVFDMYLNKGLGFYSIAKQLNEQGIPSKQKKEWSIRSVKLMLSNPAYIGTLVWNRTDRGNKRKTLKDEEKWITVPHSHPAIIDTTTWEAVQKKLAKPNIHPRSKTSPHLLGGILKCGKCGSGMSISWHGSKNNRKRVYRCSANKNKGTCTSKYYVANDVEAWFKQGLLQLTRSIGTSYSIELEHQVLGTQREEVSKQIQIVKKRYQRKVEAYTAGLIELEDLQEEKKRLDNRISELDSFRDSNPVNIKKLENEINRKLTSVLDALDTLPIVEAKSLVQTLVEKLIVFDEENIEIVLDIPLG